MNQELAKEYTEEDYKRSMLPYKCYLEALEEVFDFSVMDSCLDLGCNNGRFLEAALKKFPHLDVLGTDYFKWSIDYADSSIKGRLQLMDLAQKQKFAKRYDLVNCSEVGEHIERSAEDVFINNLVEATGQILVLTWSNEPSHGNDQHQNPRPRGYIIKKLENKGLKFWPEASRELSAALKNNLSGIGHQWWADNIMVFRRTKFMPIGSQYYLQGVNTDNINHQRFFQKSGLYYQSLQKSFIRLTQYILARSGQNKATAILRASDGDYFFIRKIGIGSAKPGRRALTKRYDDINIPFYRKMFWHNDLITISIEKPMHRAWKKFIFFELADRVLWKAKFKILGHEGFKVIQHVLDPILSLFSANPLILYPLISFVAGYKGEGYKKAAGQIVDKTYMHMESFYALIASKWIFRNFKNQIGLIGSGPKLDLIKQLMAYPEYRSYLGMDAFTDYLPVPQIGAADNVQELAGSLGEKISKSRAKIFLVAAGSSKIALMPLLKAYSDAVFIDVGCGMDALAGVVLQTRPYFADWVDYKIKGYNYSQVDFMDQGATEWGSEKFKNVILEKQ